MGLGLPGELVLVMTLGFRLAVVDLFAVADKVAHILRYLDFHVVLFMQVGMLMEERLLYSMQSMGRMLKQCEYTRRVEVSNVSLCIDRTSPFT